jgi:hypothetical protein
VSINIGYLLVEWIRFGKVGKSFCWNEEGVLEMKVVTLKSVRVGQWWVTV